MFLSVKLCYRLKFSGLHQMLKWQPWRMSGSCLFKWNFGAEKFSGFSRNARLKTVYTFAQLLMPLGVSRALSENSNLLKIYPVLRFRKGQQKLERDHRNKTPRIWRKKEGTAGKKLSKKRFMFLRSLIHLLFVRSRSLEHKAREDFS